ncbi:MAG: radical SAM protein [Candidatus Omnitrophica bacterium]|nr:radical SAM protein [Candidatus Omnitrophota bacterium]MDD5351972.1 radical SAM protein [Candidatus Omnitrophota bacterium]MDD5550798.1 radical SAM protein [Candidatus Omnitrophota bacterium]
MNVNLPNLVLSDKRGRIFVHPGLKMLGFSNNKAQLPLRQELIAMPCGSTLFYMPGHLAMGYERETDCEVFVSEYKGERVFPVSAFLIPGYTRLFLPAAKKIDKKITLPLWSYTAIGWQKGKYWVTAIKIDPLSRQRPHYYNNIKLLNKNVKLFLRRYPSNRLFKHLANCALNYNCRAAQNLFFRRWEAPLPTSPSCNANCLGCLSLQDSDCVAASHQRIKFIPTPAEIAEVAVSHLESAKEAIVSFGQGCEGEPLLQFETLRQAIIKIRQLTSRGTIHLNTNAYNPQYLKELADVGLNSVRISINSFQENLYDIYYRQKGYKFSDVLSSIKRAKKFGLFVSLNLLVFPGLTDTPKEIHKLTEVLKRGCVDILQLRNLCIDSELYLAKIPKIKEKPLGILKMIGMIKKSMPRIRFGYFNLPKERFES